MSSNPVAPKTSKKNEMDFEIFMEALRMSHAQSMKGLMSRQNKKIMVEYNRQMKKQLRFVANSERTFILPHEEGEEKSADEPPPSFAQYVEDVQKVHDLHENFIEFKNKLAAQAEEKFKKDMALLDYLQTFEEKRQENKGAPIYDIPADQLASEDTVLIQQIRVFVQKNQERAEKENEEAERFLYDCPGVEFSSFGGCSRKNS